MYREYKLAPLFSAGKRDYAFTIVDDDFTDRSSASSIWHAIVEVYSKRNLNVWANFALAYTKFLEYQASIWNQRQPADRIDHQSMLRYFETVKDNLSIDWDKLNSYLQLI